MKITVELLKQHQACWESLETFKRHFLGSAHVTAETWAAAKRLQLPTGWLHRLIPQEGQSEYHSKRVQIVLEWDRDTVARDAAYNNNFPYGAAAAREKFAAMLHADREKCDTALDRLLFETLRKYYSPPRTLTTELLRRKRACTEQIELFRKLFGESAELTADNWATAQKGGMSVLWLWHLLPSSLHAEYKQECRRLNEQVCRARQRAWAQYDSDKVAEGVEYARARREADIARIENTAELQQAASLFTFLQRMETV